MAPRVRSIKVYKVMVPTIDRKTAELQNKQVCMMVIDLPQGARSLSGIMGSVGMGHFEQL